MCSYIYKAHRGGRPNGRTKHGWQQEATGRAGKSHRSHSHFLGEIFFTPPQPQPLFSSVPNGRSFTVTSRPSAPNS